MVLDYYATRRFIFGRLLIDKDPLEPIALPDTNYIEYLENLQFLFPDIQFLFVIRDPVATLWSMRNRKWGYSLMTGEPIEYSLCTCIDIWNRNAEAIAHFAGKSNCLVVHFESLVTSPAESEKVLSFLNIRSPSRFVAAPTKTIGFTAEDKERIIQATETMRAIFGYVP
jgi:hypothetical protein